MYKNVGKLIKTLAEIICILCIGASALISVLVVGTDDFSFQKYFIMLIIVAAGCAAGFCSSIGLYGFGELIFQTTATREMNEEILKSLESNRRTNERILAILEAQYGCEHNPDTVAYQAESGSDTTNHEAEELTWN